MRNELNRFHADANIPRPKHVFCNSCGLVGLRLSLPSTPITLDMVIFLSVRSWGRGGLTPYHFGREISTLRY